MRGRHGFDMAQAWAGFAAWPIGNSCQRRAVGIFNREECRANSREICEFNLQRVAPRFGTERATRRLNRRIAKTQQFVRPQSQFRR